MKKSRIFIVGVAFIAFALMPFVYRSKKRTAALPIEEKITKIQVEQVKKQDFEKYLSVSAEIKSSHEVTIIPKIAAQVMDYALQDHTPVIETTPLQKGQVFAILDNQDLQLHVKRSESMVTSAESLKEIAKISYEDKAKDKKRMENLFQQGAITQKQWEMAQIEYERSQSQLDQAKAQLLQAQANLELDKYRLNQSYIVSPIDGVLAKKHLSIGDMTSPQAPIATVISLQQMKMLAGIPYEYLSQLDIENCSIFVEYQNHTYPAKLSHIHPKIDSATRTVTLEMILENPYDLIQGKKQYLFYPGMIVSAKIYLQKKHDVLSASKNSVIHMDGQDYVFVYQNGMANRQAIKVGIENGDRIEVIEGLAEEDMIITEGQHKITQGSKVFYENDDGEKR